MPGLPQLALVMVLTALFSPTAMGAAIEEIDVKYNIVYSPKRPANCSLDLAIPRSATGLRPAIVVIHGGGWIEGDKSSFASAEHGVPGNIVDFARAGFVAATINYRLAGAAPYPAALDDCREAVRFLRQQADEYQIDPTRIGAYGNSAGGHLALLLAVAEDPPIESGQQAKPNISCRVQCAASDSGPLDLARQFRQDQLRTVIMKFLGGPPESDRRRLYDEASPTTYISRSLPPLMLIYGETDEQVDVRTADDFVASLSRAGHKDVTYLRLAGVGHCPHSLVRVPFTDAAVRSFFVRSLRADD
ncbi:MAG: alpha/beta hydrolase [Singulisphaera sp.]